MTTQTFTEAIVQIIESDGYEAFVLSSRMIQIKLSSRALDNDEANERCQEIADSIVDCFEGIDLEGTQLDHFQNRDGTYAILTLDEENADPNVSGDDDDEHDEDEHDEGPGPDLRSVAFAVVKGGAN